MSRPGLTLAELLVALVLLSAGILVLVAAEGAARRERRQLDAADAARSAARTAHEAQVGATRREAW